MRRFSGLPVVLVGGLFVVSCRDQPQGDLTSPETSSFSRLASAAQYEEIDLGTLGGDNSYAFRVNNGGQVVGRSVTSSGQTHAFLWDKGVMTDLGTLGGSRSSANDLNDRGQVVGSSLTTDGYWHAFIWEKGVMTDLGTLGGRVSGASSINNRGQVVGSSPTSSGVSHAFLWERGVMTDLGFGGLPRGINDRGQITGELTLPSRGYLWEHGELTLLPPVMLVYGINNRGQIIGEWYPPDESPRRAFVWEDGVMNLIASAHSTAWDISDRGQVVGVGGDFPLFLWDKGEMIDLSSLESNCVMGINNRGQIAGCRESRAKLWTPIN